MGIKSFENLRELLVAQQDAAPANPKKEEGEPKELRITRIPKEILADLGFSENDYTYEVEGNTARFTFPMPDEAVEERRANIRRLDGFLEPTSFHREKITPFYRELNSKGFEARFVSEDTDYVVVEVQKRK